MVISSWDWCSSEMLKLIRMGLEQLPVSRDGVTAELDFFITSNYLLFPENQT